MVDYNRRSLWLRGVARHINDRDIVTIIHAYADQLSTLAKLQGRSSYIIISESDDAYPLCRGRSYYA
jgi:hypothetical protein